MVVYIKALSIDKNKWLDEDTFQEGVALCQTIPGATAMQTAAYVGLKARGMAGALLSYIGFGLPAFCVMLVFSSLYARYHELPKVIALFADLQAIIVAIIVNAVLSFGKGTIKSYKEIIIIKNIN